MMYVSVSKNYWKTGGQIEISFAGLHTFYCYQWLYNSAIMAHTNHLSQTKRLLHKYGPTPILSFRLLAVCSIFTNASP